jgi:hypothetical protein
MVILPGAKVAMGTAGIFSVIWPWIVTNNVELRVAVAPNRVCRGR